MRWRKGRKIKTCSLSLRIRKDNADLEIHNTEAIALKVHCFVDQCSFHYTVLLKSKTKEFYDPDHFHPCYRI